MKKVPLNQRNSGYYLSLQQQSAVVFQNQKCLGVVYSRLAECGACSTVELETARREMVLKYYQK